MTPVARSNENMVSGQCRFGASTNSSSCPPPRSSVSPPLTARSFIAALASAGTNPFKKERHTLEPTTVASGNSRSTEGTRPLWSGSVCEQTT